MKTRHDIPVPGRLPVLVVDDDAVTVGLLRRMLSQAGYEVLTAADGREAIDILRRRPVPLVLTDWVMPVVSGVELCRWIRSQAGGRHVFILMLTSFDDEGRLVEALAAGVDEFLRKPICTMELEARLKSARRMLGLCGRDTTIYVLAQLADSRDPAMGDHLDRMRCYARLLTEEVVSGWEAGDDGPSFVERMYATSPLHDIGKVGIPDSILLKPGQLSNTEFEVMKGHTTIGANALERAMVDVPGMDFLCTARDIALTHHERFDGTGYPSGLCGGAIPLVGRIVALCDAYEAMTSRRVYKSAKPHHVARAEIVRSAGTHFDPGMVDAFLAVEAGFQEISGRGEGVATAPLFGAAGPGV